MNKAIKARADKIRQQAQDTGYIDLPALIAELQLRVEAIERLLSTPAIIARPYG